MSYTKTNLVDDTLLIQMSTAMPAPLPHQNTDQYSLPAIPVSNVGTTTVTATFHYDAINGPFTCDHCGVPKPDQWCYEIQVAFGNLKLESYAYSCHACYAQQLSGIHDI
jgi:hypothetical protein